MRGLSMEADCTQSKRVVSMMWIKREGGSKVTPSLSESEEGMRSGRWERASGPASNFPGTWIIFRSKLERSRSQQAWHWFRAWG